jgi:hypothetical protein
MAFDRPTREGPVYDNESYWWSAPVRENYLGLDRGPVPAEGPEESAAFSSDCQPEASTVLPARQVGPRPIQQFAGWSPRRSGR